MDSKKIITQYMSELGKRSAQKLTKEQRIERARKAGSMKGKKLSPTTPLQDTTHLL